jgi:hypothetical protein
MTVDPTDPDTFESENNDIDTADSTEIAVEAPEGDAAEQLADIAPRRDDRPSGEDTDRASEGDLAEQARVVELDEDDYR